MNYPFWNSVKKMWWKTCNYFSFDYNITNGVKLKDPSGS